MILIQIPYMTIYRLIKLNILLDEWNMTLKEKNVPILDMGSEKNVLNRDKNFTVYR